MKVGTISVRLREWLLRSAALREARAAVDGPGGRRARAQAQAQLLAEVGKRVAEPVEPLPEGARAGAQLSLYRDAIYWALVATLPDDQPPPGDLASAWAESPPERIEHAAGGAEAADELKKTLLETTAARAFEISDEQAGRARALADALIAELDAPRRRVEWILLQRWLRAGAVVLVCLVAGYGIRALSLGTNLAAAKRFRTSSSYGGCTPDGGCESIFFHTEQENGPWVELDLGAPKTIHRIEVANRPDCCQDRAAPLIAEISTDRVKWTEVARREDEFMNWTATFPRKTARYVRLRVPRVSTLHLKDVAVR
jgi:hypothetical protein